MHNSVECTTELTFVISTLVIFYEKNKILPIAKPKLQFHIKIDWAYLENLKLIELTLKM